MDMYKKRELRAKKRQENVYNGKNGTCTCISWYPGHMHNDLLK